VAGARARVGIRAVPRGALADGWLAGLSFFVVLLRWLDHTFESYSAIPWPLTWLPIGALAAYCGLYVGVVSAAVSWLGNRLGRGWGLAAAPALWVAGEWIRGWLMGGFPWGLLGYSQHRTLAVIQIAEIGGVYAVSLVIVAVNAALASWCVLGSRRAAPGATAAAVLAAGSLAFGWWVLAHEYGRRRVVPPRPSRWPSSSPRSSSPSSGIPPIRPRPSPATSTSRARPRARNRGSSCGPRRRHPFSCAAIPSCSRG